MPTGDTHQSHTILISYLLIVLGLELEVSLWVNTYGAYLRSLLAYVDVTTVRALPDHIAIA